MMTSFTYLLLEIHPYLNHRHSATAASEMHRQLKHWFGNTKRMQVILLQRGSDMRKRLARLFICGFQLLVIGAHVTCI